MPAQAPFEPADACPLCRSGVGEVLSTRGRDGAPLTTVLCGGCGLTRTDPLPSAEELETFYQERYRLAYKGSATPKARRTARAGRLAAERLKAYQDYLPRGGRVLDIGGGGGEWLYALKSRGFAAEGLDPSAAYAAYARRNLGVDLREGVVERARYEPGAFQAVTLFHVIEHLRDPVGVLARCREWLAADGRLIVEAPNIASRHQHPRKRFHAAHLFGFTPRTLSTAGLAAGLEPVWAGTDESTRNVAAVFAKADRPIPARPSPEAAAAARLALRERSLWSYYLALDSWLRAGCRLKRFAGEFLAGLRRPEPRSQLDAILARSA